VILVALIATAVAPAAASAACGNVEQGKAKESRGDGRPPVAVGDSVMLGALGNLARAGFDVDARVCRQMDEGVDVLRARKRAGRLPRVAVIALGTNGVVTTRDIRRAMRVMGPERVLGLVTPRETGGVSSADQARIRAAGRRWPRRVRVLDWVRHSRGHGSWLGGDGLHLGAAGARGFTRLLARAIKWTVTPPEEDGGAPPVEPAAA